MNNKKTALEDLYWSLTNQIDNLELQISSCTGLMLEAATPDEFLKISESKHRFMDEHMKLEKQREQLEPCMKELPAMKEAKELLRELVRLKQIKEYLANTEGQHSDSEMKELYRLRDEYLARKKEAWPNAATWFAKYMYVEPLVT